MSRVASIFRPGRKALIAYLTAGYPSREVTGKAASVLADSGCDIIELCIPFSDPLADGATIQRASYQALKRGITPRDCIEIAAKLSREIATPLVFMSYYNPILSFGLEAFCQASARAGVDGLIVPDLPPDEGEELELSTRRHGLDLIYLLTPTSTEARIALVAEKSQGFIYLVSLTGVTGARQTLPAELEGFVRRVRGKTAKPLCVGFGVSNPEQAARVAQVADGVIVGSRLLELITEDASLASLKSAVLSLRQALNQDT
jgi:tryptophan synthase alpha chain